jgi:hypothetical protein
MISQVWGAVPPAIVLCAAQKLVYVSASRPDVYMVQNIRLCSALQSTAGKMYLKNPFVLVSYGGVCTCKLLPLFLYVALQKETYFPFIFNIYCSRYQLIPYRSIGYLINHLLELYTTQKSTQQSFENNG